jgi:hypothetical protein
VSGRRRQRVSPALPSRRRESSARATLSGTRCRGNPIKEHLHMSLKPTGEHG